MRTLIKNVNIICENKILYNHYLVIEDDKINDIKRDMSKCKVDEVIDGEGNYLSPGFIDIHNHGSNGFDAMDATKEALEGIGKYHIKNGVTSFLATTMTDSNEKTKEVISNVAKFIENEKCCESISKCKGIYLEGPYLSTEKCGAQSTKYMRDPDLNDLKELIRIGNSLIKIIALAPERNGSEEAIEYLVEKGICVSLAHSNATYEEAKKAFDQGANQITHMFNGMRKFSHRDPGLVGAAMLSSLVKCELICDGIHVHPVVMRLLYECKGSENIILVSDAMRAAGLNDGEFELGGQSVIVKKSVARLADGTIAGSTLSLYQAIKNMVRFVNVPLVEAVRMASLNPAKQLNLSNEIGSIREGKIADLVLFDENINVKRVFINGKEMNLDI